MDTTTTHDLRPVETGSSQYVEHAALYRQSCTCGWASKWYVHKGNATKAAANHQHVNQ